MELNLTKDIANLSNKQLLISTYKFNVYISDIEQIPNIILEIGRLRELTFKEIGEGSGNYIDLDDFDFKYLHIFIWNNQCQEVVGGYRIGLINLLIDEHDSVKTYTHTLFEYSDLFFKYMSKAIEIGRLFIRYKYQKNFLPFRLLWEAIFIFLTKNTQYTTLLGSVSISRSYSDYSRSLIVKYLSCRFICKNKNLRDSVYPRKSFLYLNNQHFFNSNKFLMNLSTLDKIIRKHENNLRGFPSILEFYLKLGSIVLDFCVDSNFSKTLDILLFLNLKDINYQILSTYISKQTYANYYSKYH